MSQKIGFDWSKKKVDELGRHGCSVMTITGYYCPIELNDLTVSEAKRELTKICDSMKQTGDNDETVFRFLIIDQKEDGTWYARIQEETYYYRRRLF